MALPTAFTGLVGSRLPLQLAPMGGGVGNPGLALAVCEAGGLGMLSSAHPMPLAEQLDWLGQRTEEPFGVGFFAFDVEARAADVELASSRARVVDVFWGEPDSAVVQRIHGGGGLALWQVGSLDEAVAAADAGCDAVVAQGVEAGGHVRGTTPLLELLDQVVPRLSVPVVAAGGLSTAVHARRAFDAGASALRVGTRLLATHESAAHPSYLQALVDATAEDTVLTTAFGNGWEDAPHRVLRSAVDAAAASGDPVAQAELGGRRWDVAQWSPQPPSTSCSGNIAAMALYAGMGVTDVVDVRSAAEVVSELLSR